MNEKDHQPSEQADMGHGEALQRHKDDLERLVGIAHRLTIRQMMATLAHELRQPVGTLVNLLGCASEELSRPGVADKDHLREVLDRAMEQALFAGRVISSMRAHAQSQDIRRKALNLVSVVRESVQLLEWEILRDGVTLRLQFPAEVIPLEGDGPLLQQVFVNLIRNALDAMRELPENAARTLSVQAVAANGDAMVSIEDTGPGMSKDVEARLFMAHVSTKPTGMGMGLNICRSVVEQHAGVLQVQSVEPTGCRFIVTLPLTEAPYVPAEQRGQALSSEMAA